MPSNLVKTKRDERLWEEAKQAVHEEYGSIPRKRYWALVNSVYRRMKYRTGSHAPPPAKKRKRNPPRGKNGRFRSNPRKKGISLLLLLGIGVGVYFLWKRSKAQAASPAKETVNLPGGESYTAVPVDGFGTYMRVR